MANDITVSLRKAIDRSYRVQIRSKIFDEIPALIRKRWPESKVFIITDANVEQYWGRRLHRFFHEAGFDSRLLSFAPGEQAKNAAIAYALQSHLLENGIRRNSLIIALGGGVVGDVAGYVAATVLRGVEFVQVPTTLLAQVDSSVGGKVGIDHPIGKNLIGAFHQPAAVYVDTECLRTLSLREFRNGLAEVVKIAAALDAGFFSFLERNAHRLTRTNQPLLARTIAQSISLKAAVVRKDEFETGLRKALNLGHTIGHAIESAADFSLKHGEAVAIGMVAESRLAMQMGLLRRKEFDRLVRLIRSLKLPFRLPALPDHSKFYTSLLADKKSVSGGAQFTLLNGIGRSAVGVGVPLNDIERLMGHVF